MASKNLVPIEEKDLGRYMKMQTLADQMAEYITSQDNEAEDFATWCDEQGLEEFTLGEKHLDHIFATVKFYQHLSGYDIAPYCFTTEFLEENSYEI